MFNLCFADGPENLQISSSKSGMGVVDGQSVNITCTAVSNPPSTFTFFHNNSAVLTGSISGVLTISSFGRNDSGNYSCMAINRVGNATVEGVWFFYVEPIISKYNRNFLAALSLRSDGMNFIEV